MKKFPPKERPTWCTLRLLTWDELISSTEVPVWLEIKGFEHLNQWWLVDTDDVTGTVSLIASKGYMTLKTSTARNFLPTPHYRKNNEY